jgi:hypothetical protein
MLPPLKRNCCASSEKSTSCASGTWDGHTVFQIRRRSSSSGNGKSTMKRMRRVNAASMFCRRFVDRIAIPGYSSIFCRRYAVSVLA